MIDDPAVVASIPDVVSILNCNAAPAACPAGMMLVIAPLASCDVATENHAFVRSAMRCRFQKHTRLRISVTTTATNHNGLTRSRSCHEPSTDTSAGNNR